MIPKRSLFLDVTVKLFDIKFVNIDGEWFLVSASDGAHRRVEDDEFIDRIDLEVLMRGDRLEVAR